MCVAVGAVVSYQRMDSQAQRTATEGPEVGQFLTSREACDRLGYSRPDSFLRAWRAAELPLYRRPGGHYVVAWDDVEDFLSPA